MNLWSWIDSWTERRRELVAGTALTGVVVGVVAQVAGSVRGVVGRNGAGAWLLWTGLAIMAVSVVVSVVIVWRRHLVVRRAGQVRERP